MAQLTWLVTGCSSGFGELFIRQIIARGDKAIATARGPVSRLKALAEAGAKVYSLDVTDSPAVISSTVAEISKENGGIDVLVNNAGYVEAGLCEELGFEEYKAQFETNFFGVVKTTQAVLPHFREKKAGIVAIVGSIGGVAGEVGGGAYCATKFALEGWHDALRQELAPFGVTSILFEPGVFRTQVFHQGNLKTRNSNPISDYDGMRSGVEGFLQNIDGNQPGDPNKAVKIMLDVVKGEGIAKGKPTPSRLPIGMEVIEKRRTTCKENLEICDEWEAEVGNTNFD